jgi:hypothetical protein
MSKHWTSRRNSVYTSADSKKINTTVPKNAEICLFYKKNALNIA